MNKRGKYPSLEPYFRYKVSVTDIFGDLKDFTVLARSEYEATDKVFTKFHQWQPDRSKYKFGKKILF